MKHRITFACSEQTWCQWLSQHCLWLCMDVS